MRVGAPNGALDDCPERNASCAPHPLYRWTKAGSLRKLLVSNQAGRRIRAGLGVVPRSISIILLLYYLVIPRRGDIILAFQTAPRDPLAIVANNGPSDGKLG